MHDTSPRRTTDSTTALDRLLDAVLALLGDDTEQPNAAERATRSAADRQAQRAAVAAAIRAADRRALVARAARDPRLAARLESLGLVTRLEVIEADDGAPGPPDIYDAADWALSCAAENSGRW